MFCRQCGNPIPDQTGICNHCGAATGIGTKDRTCYILLGVLLGVFGFPGIHNIYAGNTSRGILQLLLTLLTCWILWIPVFIWTVVEICMVTRDADGRTMT